MPCEAYNRSLPQRRAAVNTPQVASITPAQLRMTARMEVVCDSRLSPGARLLYVLLDDRSGMKAVCWHGQARLAADLGVSRRSVQEWLYELEAIGMVLAARGREGNRYHLAWGNAHPAAQPTREECAPECEPVAHPAAHPINTLTEPEPEPGPCMRCHGTHRILYRGQVRACGCTVG